MAKRKRRTRKEWEQLVEQYRGSGVSQRVFAERHQLSAKSLSRWTGRLSREQGENPALVLSRPGFAEVIEKRPSDSNGRADLVNGTVLFVGESVRLQLPDWPSPAYVALVARCYEELTA